MKILNIDYNWVFYKLHWNLSKKTDLLLMNKNLITIFQNLLDGVSSLLNDLLGIIQTWLCVETNAILDSNQFCHIVNLFDPSQISTTIRAIECIFLTLSKNSQLGNEVSLL